MQHCKATILQLNKNFCEIKTFNKYVITCLISKRDKIFRYKKLINSTSTFNTLMESLHAYSKQLCPIKEQNAL